MNIINAWNNSKSLHIAYLVMSYIFTLIPKKERFIFLKIHILVDRSICCTGESQTPKYLNYRIYNTSR